MTNLFLDLLNMSITAGYLVLAIAVVRLVFKKLPKWINCLLWVLVGVRLICPVSFESGFSLIPSSQTVSVNTESVGRPFTIQTGVPVVDTGINNYMGDRYYEGVTVPANTFTNLTDVLSIIWIIGLIALLVYGLVSYIRLRKKVSASLLFKDNIYFCDNIDTPFILGIFGPKIYVPSGIGEEQLNYIIMHERAHLKRKDHFWKPLGFILLAVYWFNPAIWVAYILLCRDIESACDEKVIKNMDNAEKKSYSETLVSCSVQRRTVMTCPVAFGEVGVKQRIKTVLNYKKPTFWVIILSFVLFAVVAVCFLTNPDGNNSSIGIIGGADGPTSIIVGNTSSEKELKKLEEKYPHFFNIDTQEGVTVYVTKTSRDNYECYLSSNKNPSFPPEIMNFDKFADIGEMRTILSVYGLQRDMVTLSPFQHMLSSYLWDDSEVSITNMYLLLGFESQSTNAGIMHKLYDRYYYSVIDAESELTEYGLYYLSEDTTGVYILVDNLGSAKPYFVVYEDTLFYTGGNKLKSVSPDGTHAVTVYGGDYYGSELDYDIHSIEIAKDGYIYCEGDRWGKTPETKNDRETVYLSIRILDGFFEEISENDIPADMALYDDALGNIKATLNTDYENILVKGFRVKFNGNGKLDSAIFRVWIYKDTVANEDFWTEGNVLVTSDGTAFFNVINEEIVLLSENNPKNDGSLLTIDKIMPKIKVAVVESASFKEFEELKHYVLTFGEEKYVKYVADKSSEADYIIEKNGEFKSTEKPKELTPQNYVISDKIYFVLVPHYDKASVQTFIFEEDENLVSKDYKVMLFDRDNLDANKNPTKDDSQKAITPTTKPYIDFFTPSGERVIE